MASVLVLDAEVKAAPTIVRALGRAGHRVVVAAAEPGAPALHSRYAAESSSHPHAFDDPHTLVSWLDGAVSDRRVDCVLPLTEYSIRAIDCQRGLFAGRAALALPPASAMSTVFHKDRVLALARSLDVDVPVTHAPASHAEAEDLMRRTSFPVYIKARESFGNDGAGARFARGRFAHNPSDGMATWEKLHAIVPLPFVQDAVPGPMVAVCGTWDQGKPVTRFCYLARTSWPPSGGQSVCRHSVPPEQAPVVQADRLLGDLRWTGPAHVQFIRDERDGRFRLLEINGRFWGSLDAAHQCGAPVAVSAVKLALGDHPTPALSYRVGACSHCIEGHLKRFYALAFQRRRWKPQSLAIPGIHRPVLDALCTLRPGIHRDDFHWDDPFVPAAMLIRAVKRGVAAAPVPNNKALCGTRSSLGLLVVKILACAMPWN